MSDKELLELAARAVGGYRYIDDMGWIEALPDGGNGAWWNPLTDDGDRYRLIVKLKLSVDFEECSVWKRLASGKLIEDFWSGDYGDEPHAILRVAAEIGKASAPSTDGGGTA
jgi:hypothetical protein